MERNKLVLQREEIKRVCSSGKVIENRRYCQPRCQIYSLGLIKQEQAKRDRCGSAAQSLRKTTVAHQATPHRALMIRTMSLKNTMMKELFPLL